MSSEVSGMSRGCGIRRHMPPLSSKASSNVISLTTRNRTNDWQNTWRELLPFGHTSRHIRLATLVCSWQQHLSVDADENHFRRFFFFLPKGPEFMWKIASHITWTLQPAIALPCCSQFSAFATFHLLANPACCHVHWKAAERLAPCPVHQFCLCLLSQPKAPAGPFIHSVLWPQSASVPPHAPLSSLLS